MNEIDKSGKWQLVRTTGGGKSAKKEEVVVDDLDYETGVKMLRGVTREVFTDVYYVLHKKEFVPPCTM